MPNPNPSAMSAGLPPGFGEAFDESKTSQGPGAISQNSGGGNTSNTQTATQNQLAQQMGAGASGPVKPREISSLKDELITRPVKDIVKGLASLFDIKSILGINPQVDTPEQQMKKKQLHQRFQQLTQEQQQVAQQKYQREMERKQRMEQEEQIRKQREAEAQQEDIAPPSSPSKGPASPSGTGKQKAAAKIKQDRTTLGGPMAVD